MQEETDIDPQALPEALLHATEPVLVRGLAARWPAVQAARESARAFTQADSLMEARSAARMATRVALSDQGVPLRGDELRIDCDGSCLAPGSTIRVSVSTRVRLPFLPDSLVDSTVGAVPVSAEHLAVVDDPAHQAGKCPRSVDLRDRLVRLRRNAGDK